MRAERRESEASSRTPRRAGDPLAEPGGLVPAIQRFARERARSGLTARLALQTARAWQASGDSRRAASWYRSALRLDPGLDAPRDSLAALEARGAP